jgi:hypothetical protein
MARSEARVYNDIWDDGDFVALPPRPQRDFMFLISQDDLAHTGVIPLRERRWARKSAGMTAVDWARDLDVLEAARFVVVDRDTEELLVRSLMRRDKIFKQPNVMRAAVSHARTIESGRILREIASEVARIRRENPDLTKDQDAALSEMEEVLAERVRPDRAASSNHPPENPSANPSRNPSAMSTAKESGGRGSVTRVSTDSPFPDSPLIPLPADASPPSESAIVGKLVARWLEQCKARPPERVIGHMSREIKNLVREGILYDHIEAGISDFLTKDVSPGLLPNLVNAAMNRRAPASRASPGQPNFEPGYFQPLKRSS